LVTCLQAQATQKYKKIPNKKRDRDTIFVLPKFGLRRVLLSIEGAASDPAKVSSRGHMKVTLDGVFSYSFFSFH
jgi:hypothetical protein